MTFSKGSCLSAEPRLGPYDIVVPFGAGSMGVYREPGAEPPELKVAKERLIPPEKFQERSQSDLLCLWPHVRRPRYH
jgi:hypothetical protein